MERDPLRIPKRRFKKRYVLLFGLVLLATTFFIAGYFATPAYEGDCERRIHAPASEVWSLLNDVPRFGKYRHQVKSLTMEPASPDGLKRWTEHTLLAGDMHFEITELVPGQVLVTRMIKSGFGMTGSWEFRLWPKDNETRVVIIERSETKGLVMRSILNAVGRKANMNILLDAIEKGTKK